MKTLGDRVKQKRLELGLSQERLAELAGVSQGLIGQIENGRNKGSKHIVDLAHALKCSVEWLDSGREARYPQVQAREPTHPDEQYGFEAIRRVKFKLSAGISGFEIEYVNEHSAPIFFRKDWLEKKGFDAEQLFAVNINGRSMEPSLFEGDCVVVNTGDQAPRDGEVFALNYDGELVVKRLVREGDGWFMRSDNPDKIRFGDRRCDERAQIIGRVVHKQSERI